MSAINNASVIISTLLVLGFSYPISAKEEDSILDYLPAILSAANPPEIIEPSGEAPLILRKRCSPGNPVIPLPEVQAGSTVSMGAVLYDPDTEEYKLKWYVSVNGNLYQDGVGKFEDVIYSTLETDRGLFRFHLEVTDDSANITRVKLCDFQVIAPISNPQIDAIESITIDDKGGLESTVVTTITGLDFREGAILSIVDDPTEGLLSIDPDTLELIFQGDITHPFGQANYYVMIKVVNPDGAEDTEKFVLYVNDSA